MTSRVWGTVVLVPLVHFDGFYFCGWVYLVSLIILCGGEKCF